MTRALVTLGANGRQILDSSKLPALHAAVMAECADANGVIRDPRPARLTRRAFGVRAASTAPIA